jgi:hypothetical protein
MILVIRGHIRNSFETRELYNFVESLYNITPDLNIYIHTWNIFSNNISWRHIEIDNRTVNEEIINKYFGKYSSCIKHIIIDNDKNVKLIGNLEGKINNGLAPIIGWKNYWYGKHRIIDYIYNQNIDLNEMIVNFRFDIFDNSNNFDNKFIVNFIKNNIGKKFTKNIFMYNDEHHNGIDNIYIGNIRTMYKLVCTFHFNLDSILFRNNNIINQERLVYRINSMLFD